MPLSPSTSLASRAPRFAGAPLAWAALPGIGLAWGATGLLAKIAAGGSHGAVQLAFWQTLIAVTVFTAILRVRGMALPLGRRHLLFYAVCGLLGTALPHTVSFVSIRHLPVGVQALTLSTVPMLTLVLALVTGAERGDPRRVLGIVLGLAAMLLIVLPGSSLPERGQALWLLLPMLVALSYAGENTVIAASRPEGLKPVQVMCGLSWAAALMLAPLVAMAEGPVLPAAIGMAEAALVACALLHVVAYFGFVWLIGHAGPVFAAQVGYLVTASGIGWGMALLGERHSPWVWAAAVLVFAGLALVRPRRCGESPTEG
ncbi:hypothetical protein LNKW23_19570 [Paralimibaculum aggregatum]|uniref:EamA domain-containing protein n=1 Tax=Paralimibaculum aggregatum TaxID=3036245 RepID=A0ABQ6LHH4_9RHOB|nr:DMT family transporter [Limibaculum sp. NKW23]GMG82744.1 hypothetical protein LNKW23_19570 [Limibaculum sp. NKW23]